MDRSRIAIIGEYNKSFKPHEKINEALNILGEQYSIDYEWIETTRLSQMEEAVRVLAGYDGIWSAPGSPFKSLEGALNAIQFAREKDVPHLGTCAGFQHTIIEYARNVLGISEAQHEEYVSDASMLFISKLSCSLAGKSMTVAIKDNTLAYTCYKQHMVTEDYYCNFGINPAFEDQVESEKLVISGVDQDGEIRIVEVPQNRFFLATLFVPQSTFTRANQHPIIRKFIESCCLE